MADKDVLFEFGRALGATARSVFDVLGLGVDPRREDLAAQVDGADALSVVKPRWAPAVDGAAVTSAALKPTGKVAEASPLFGFRGSLPMTLGWSPFSDRDLEEDPGEIVWGEVETKAGPLPAVLFYRDSEDHGGNVPEGPAPDVLAVGSPGTEFVEMKVYPSFFRPGR